MFYRGNTAGVACSFFLISLATLAPSFAQTVYWTGPHRTVERNCNADEIQITYGFNVACVSKRVLKDDAAFQDVLNRLKQAEARATVLETNVKTLSAANDALTKRIEDLEATKPFVER